MRKFLFLFAMVCIGSAVVLTQQFTEQDTEDAGNRLKLSRGISCHLVRIIFVLFQDHMSHRRSDTAPLTHRRCRLESGGVSGFTRSNFSRS